MLLIFGAMHEALLLSFIKSRALKPISEEFEVPGIGPHFKMIKNIC